MEEEFSLAGACKSYDHSSIPSKSNQHRVDDVTFYDLGEVDQDEREMEITPAQEKWLNKPITEGEKDELYRNSHLIDDPFFDCLRDVNKKSQEDSWLDPRWSSKEKRAEKHRLFRSLKATSIKESYKDSIFEDEKYHKASFLDRNDYIAIKVYNYLRTRSTLKWYVQWAYRSSWEVAAFLINALFLKNSK